MACSASSTAASERALTELDQCGRHGNWHIFGREVASPTWARFCSARATMKPRSPNATSFATAQIAPIVIPYLAGRAVNMHRYPDGIDAAGF